MNTVESFWRGIYESNIQTRPIKIPGMKEAFVVLKDGEEVGTVMRTSGQSAYTASLGVGKGAKHLGNFHTDANLKALSSNPQNDMRGTKGGGLKAAVAAVAAAA